MVRNGRVHNASVELTNGAVNRNGNTLPYDRQVSIASPVTIPGAEVLDA
jgi:hypothetical protein